MVVPKTYTKYTSRKVLTTQWIDGEKLSQSTASDVGDLVNVGVICYLKQVTILLVCSRKFMHYGDAIKVYPIHDPNPKYSMIGATGQ